MTEADVRILKENNGKQVGVRCMDGEIMKIKVISASESEGDVVYDLISTNKPERYAGRAPNTAHLTKFDEIDTVMSGPSDLAPQGHRPQNTTLPGV